MSKTFFPIHWSSFIFQTISNLCIKVYYVARKKMSCRYVSFVYHSLSPQIFFKTTEWLLIQKIGNDIFPCPCYSQNRNHFFGLPNSLFLNSELSRLSSTSNIIIKLNDVGKYMYSLKSRNLVNLSSYVGKIKRRIPFSSKTFCILTCSSFLLKYLGMNSSLVLPSPVPFPSLPLLLLPLPLLCCHNVYQLSGTLLLSKYLQSMFTNL